MLLKTFRAVCVVISIIIMIAIFCFSAQEASESADTSRSFISSVAKSFTKDFDTLSSDEQETIISEYHFFTRKLAHFSLFAALGIFVLLSLITYEQIKFKIKIFISLLISAVYAASDEIHQLFVEGRSCELRDFGIDLCGCILGVFLGIMSYIIFLKIKRRNLYVEKEIG